MVTPMPSSAGNSVSYSSKSRSMVAELQWSRVGFGLKTVFRLLTSASQSNAARQQDGKQFAQAGYKLQTRFLL